MKICVTSYGDNMDAEVDPRFGRCKYFIIVDPETLQYEAIKNQNIEATGGAGVQSAQMMSNKGVKLILTGNIGPKAAQALKAAGISVITGVQGSVREAIEKYGKSAGGRKNS